MVSLFASIGLIASATSRRSMLALALLLELLLLSAVLISLSHYSELDEALAQSLVVLVVTIAGADATCALALIVYHSRRHASILLEY